ncbi:hypothetical protein QP986_09460 [Corynebacterium striatum]|uniref:hypothetical protein n=1 Tax=Corynebacterium striatum TaxID=43770 RepID=UPI00254DE5EB|nr:hypothetical protein [Corynebacterium striatum]MDK8844295.1 hypothetical protein [Corynebacterium striatum]
MAKKEEPTHSVAEQLQPLVDDDAFLTSLSQGQDPSAGEDELAALFLELREDVERQMPPAPIIEGAELEPEVISLAAARKRRRSRPLINGLIGAAAATLVIAGAGTAVYNAGPASPLYGVNQSLFGTDDASVVELATTLEEMERRSAEGDLNGTRELLEAARRIMDNARSSKESADDKPAPAPAPRTTVTSTETVEKDAPATNPAPAPVTVTEYQTLTSTVVVTSSAPQNPLQPTEGQTEPSEDNGEGTDKGNGNNLAPVQTQR